MLRRVVIALCLCELVASRRETPLLFVPVHQAGPLSAESSWLVQPVRLQKDVLFERGARIRAERFSADQPSPTRPERLCAATAAGAASALAAVGLGLGVEVDLEARPELQKAEPVDFFVQERDDRLAFGSRRMATKGPGSPCEAQGLPLPVDVVAELGSPLDGRHPREDDGDEIPVEGPHLHPPGSQALD